MDYSQNYLALEIFLVTLKIILIFFISFFYKNKFFHFTFSNKNLVKIYQKKNIFQTSRKIVDNLGHTNIVDLIISLVSLPMLLLFKHINQKYKKQLRNVPIPIEFFLIVIATTLSSFLEFEKESHVSTVHEVPLGFVLFIFQPKQFQSFILQKI